MNKNTSAKAAVWTGRIRDFQDSALSRKEWCQQLESPYPHSAIGSESSRQKRWRKVQVKLPYLPGFPLSRRSVLVL